MDYDVTIVGGGIVGLATARELLLRYRSLRLLLLEKEARIGCHQTGHNSGVIHSGVYYAAGSLKARLCVQGRRQLVAYCEQRHIPHRICGKLIVATRHAELGRLQALLERARVNGVEDVEMLDAAAMHRVEPAVVGLRALQVGCTGIVDFAEVARALASDIERAGGDIRTAHPLRDFRRADGGWVLDVGFRTRFIVTCGGLQADHLAQLAGAPDDMRVVPFRGDFYVLRPQRAQDCRALIYPVPDPAFPFLGVHFTRKLDGSVWVGPNAVLALARQGYGRWDVDLADVSETLGYSGFWRLAARHWRTGLAEMWRDYYKPAYLRTAQEYMPHLRAADLLAGPSGVRAQAVDREGRMVDDFSFFEADNIICVRNAPSPAATSCLAIASAVVDRAAERFRLQSTES